MTATATLDGTNLVELAFHDHRQAIVARAGSLTRDRLLAEDVAQEVFLRLWTQGDRFDPARGSLRSYLMSHAHGRSIDMVRSESARRSREDTVGRRELDSPDIEEEAIGRQIAEHVRSALDTLRHEQREAIELAFFEGMSYRQVAAALSSPEGTVKGRIRAGLRQLASELSWLR